MKKVNYHILLIIVLLTLFPTYLKAQFSGGDGSSGDPYQVATASQLDSVRHFSGSHFIQTADIDLAIAPFDTGTGWLPIDNFSGSFDGQGFIIDSLFIDKLSSGNTGLFGQISGATLNGINLTNADVTSTKGGCGILVGWALNSTITDSYSSGSISCSLNYVGGLVGTLNLSSSLKNSSSAANVVGGSNVTGGLVGYVIQSSTIANSYATGSVNGSNTVGGFVGSLGSGEQITNSYSTGSVSGSSNTGGFIGINNGTTTNSFWNTETSGFASGVGFGSTTGITGATTGQMQTKDTFTDAGWNFFSVWGIEVSLNSGYPGLLWQSGYSAPTPTIPESTTNAVSEIASTFAIFNGTVDSNNDTTVVRFVYGTSPGVYTDSLNSSQSPLIPLGGPSVSVSANVTGLLSSQTYYVRVAAENSAGYVRGEEVSFTTIGSNPPIANTGALTSILRISATVEGTVDPNEYSTTVRYLLGSTSGVYTDSVLAAESPITGDSSVSVSAEFSGLNASTTYYVRVAAESSIGYVRGDEISFTTLATPELSEAPGTALSFNATSNQAVEINSNNSLDLVDGTIECWLKPDWVSGSLDSNPAIVANRSSSATRYSIHIRNDLSAVDLWNGSSVGSIDYSFTQGEWYHLAWVTDDGTSYLYINGELIGTTSVVFSSNTGLPFSIGSNPSNKSFKGLIDEVRVWNVPRTVQELRDNMHTTLAGSETGLVSYWQFNESTGTLAADAISLNDGTLTGSPIWTTSMIPFGGGSSTGTTSFTSGTALLGKVSLTTTEDFDSSIDITSIQLNQAPNQLVDGKIILDDRYWVMNVFGSPGTFSANLAFTVPKSFTGYGTVSSSDFTLYRRNSTSDSEWEVAVTGASSVSDTSITFQGITSLGQFMLGTELLAVEISGNEGWRMMASPIASASFATLLDTLWTQGISGADATSGSSNIYTWDESAQSFTVPANMSDVPGSGKGFITFVYADDDNDGTDETFPKTLTPLGTPFSGSISPSVSYTNSGTISNDGWNLIGNPYGSAIDWGAPTGLTTSNMDASFYVWSDSANGGSGSYLSWNELTGTLDNGLIAPWQGFWVKANADSPSLSITDEARNAGGIFYKRRAEVPQIKLTLNGHNGPSKSVVVFSELASFGKDAYDAFKLAPLNADFLSLSTVIDTLAPMDIQALPITFNPFELDLNLEGSNLSDTLTLSWELKNIPENWTVELIDRMTNEHFDARQISKYGFELEDKSKRATSSAPGKLKQLNTPIRLLKAKNTAFSTESRFALAITQGSSVITEPLVDLPQAVELHQNYPNPFNPSTTINYAVPEQGHVQLFVFDMLGRKVAELLNEPKSAGRYSLNFNASNLASGMYIYRLRAGNTVLTKKLTLIK